MAADTLLTAVRAHLKLDPDHTVILEPIKRGASGRTIVRLRAEGHPPFIGIHYTLERKDNRYFLPVARFLKKNRIKAAGPGETAAVVTEKKEEKVDDDEVEYWFKIMQARARRMRPRPRPRAHARAHACATYGTHACSPARTYARIHARAAHASSAAHRAPMAHACRDTVH